MPSVSEQLNAVVKEECKGYTAGDLGNYFDKSFAAEMPGAIQSYRNDKLKESDAKSRQQIEAIRDRFSSPKYSRASRIHYTSRCYSCGESLPRECPSRARNFVNLLGKRVKESPFPCPKCGQSPFGGSFQSESKPAAPSLKVVPASEPFYARNLGKVVSSPSEYRDLIKKRMEG